VPTSFSYSVSTTLPRGRVWSLLTDITNWPKFADMCSDLHWDGMPWRKEVQSLVSLTTR